MKMCIECCGDGMCQWCDGSCEDCEHCDYLGDCADCDGTGEVPGADDYGCEAEC